MSRKRMIAPEFFTSGTMNALPVHTMVTFAGFWCYADDYGVGEDDETMVKAAAWPRRRSMTEKKVREDLDALVAAGVLCQYEVNGYRMLHVVSWSEHQKISHATPPKLPPCREHEPEAWVGFANGDDKARAKFRDASRSAPEEIRSVTGATPRQCSSDEISSAKSNGTRPHLTARTSDDLDLVANG
jgi:hypothetical protein